MKNAFKVTLRDLFWFVLVAACLCAWWAERQRAEERYYLLWEDYLTASSEAFWSKQQQLIFFPGTEQAPQPGEQ
jgi:hypothetical protein